MKLERQMAMQNSLREQQMAIQLARGRDLFHWWAAFYTVSAAGSLAGCSWSPLYFILTNLCLCSTARHKILLV